MAITFIGPNSFALKKKLREVKDEFIKKHGELAVEVIDGEESSYERMIQAVESVPFLAARKLVIIYSLSSVKEAAEKIDELTKAAGGDSELIIVEPKPDKRGTYYKYLKANTDLTEFTEPDENRLANWLASEAKNKGAKLSLKDAYYLVQRVGSNQELTSNELKKLIDYDKDISKKTIDMLTEASPQTTIFNLLDSVFGGNLKKALAIYDEQRLQGEEPLKIFGMLTWQMHLIALVDSAGNRSDAEIMSSSGLKPYTLDKSRAIARRMGRRQIGKVLSKMVSLDKQLKTTSIDADDALKNLLVSIS